VQANPADVYMDIIIGLVEPRGVEYSRAVQYPAVAVDGTEEVGTDMRTSWATTLPVLWAAHCAENADVASDAIETALMSQVEILFD
jgi:hypothetical protein